MLTDKAAFKRFRARGYTAQASRDMARGYSWAMMRGYTFHWEEDEHPDLSWCECHTNPRVQDHSHIVVVLFCRDFEGNVVSSLGGIVDADAQYQNELIAEMASEVHHEAMAASDEAFSGMLAL